ncbi:Zinc/iron permease [Umbelopsis sp. PMI_123]|nr:Zinc/iron permease [Umbelopsis sp. PMI_123]
MPPPAMLSVGILLVLVQRVSADPSADCSGESPSNYNLGMHIAAMFIIMVASGLGAFIPVFSKIFPAFRVSGKIITLGKFAGSGIILATGFIHMLPSAMANLTSPCLPAVFNTGYTAFASLFAMTAALAMQLIEHLASEHAQKRQEANAKQDAEASQTVEKIIDPRRDVSHEGTITRSQETLISHKPCQTPVNVQDAAAVMALSHIHSHHTHTHDGTNDHYPHAHHHHHQHHESHGHDHGDILLLASHRKDLSTFILEIGITFHSVIIGIALGVSPGNEFTGLLIALCFHQFFEGFALGARLVELTFETYRHAFVMAFVFAMTTPIGTVIGIGISQSYNANSTAALLTQGIFDSISAGILIYMAFVNLIATEMVHDESFMKLDHFTKWSYFVAMWVGVAIMSVIGIWA